MNTSQKITVGLLAILILGTLLFRRTVLNLKNEINTLQSKLMLCEYQNQQANANIDAQNQAIEAQKVDKIDEKQELKKLITLQEQLKAYDGAKDKNKAYQDAIKAFKSR